MPKAILELPEMPFACMDCKLKRYTNMAIWKFMFGKRNESIWICHISGEQCSQDGRRSDCPLKLVDKDILEKQTAKKVIETPDKYRYGHCRVNNFDGGLQKQV